MPIRGIVLGLGLAFVALGWWRVLQRRGRATGTVTARPPRASRVRTAEVTFQVGRQSYTFHPSVITSFDTGRLEVGAKLRSPTIRTIRRAPTSPRPGACIRGQSSRRSCTARSCTTRSLPDERPGRAPRRASRDRGRGRARGAARAPARPPRADAPSQRARTARTAPYRALPGAGRPGRRRALARSR
jgi:hypothetical protein